VSVALNGERLLDRLATMAEVGRTPSGGVTRLAWSPADVTARNLIARWSSHDGGASVRVDPAGNLIAEVPGTEPGLSPLVMGSHLDTVVEGGALDGTYGVVSGVEVLAALRAGTPGLRHPLRLVAFANEEGVTSAPFTGSLAISGGAPINLGEVGADGLTLAQRLRGAGGDPEELERARWSQAVAAYFELHIEQGPVLATNGLCIGVVTAITGRRRAQVVITGLANHAGTTPMDLRRDALVAAAHVVLATEAVAREGLTEVATVGTLSVHPGNANVIAGGATLSVDIRSVDNDRRDKALAVLGERVAAIATATGTTITMRPDIGSPAARCDPRLMGLISDAVGAAGLSSIELPSGAGHDAQHMAALCPIGMIFVPSLGGVSHNPGEATEPPDLIRGAEVLLDTLLRADNA
jgi:hydantoinase/carbamoylase family amidase